ncbi:MAG: hypothetical protein EOP92_15945 [Lysobacteraceae bacterium]|nr:MAG: hypothetical protein EOP92_15945 [Xanthomonadaceae bacterium]
MLIHYKQLNAICAPVLIGCAAQQGHYQPPPRPMIDPLPPDLMLTSKDRSLCQSLLQRFSATQQTLRDSCGDTSASSSTLWHAER